LTLRLFSTPAPLQRRGWGFLLWLIRPLVLVLTLRVLPPLPMKKPPGGAVGVFSGGDGSSSR